MSNNEELQKLKVKLNTMKLKGMANNLEKRVQDAIQIGMHPTDFLDALIDDEAMNRKNKSMKRLSHQAKFRSGATLESWDQKHPRGVLKCEFVNMVKLNFLYQNRNLIITGPTGTGKTYLAIALGRRLCQEGYTVRFFGMNLFLDEIAVNKISGKYLDFVRQIKKIKVLILDDFGLRNYTHEQSTNLLDILEERVATGITIVTSQIKPQGWKDCFEDPVLQEAICSRLIEPAEIVNFEGESYRKYLGSMSAARIMPEVINEGGSN